MYNECDLVRIAKRENNKKRNYLVVNRLQGKHIPVIPSEAFNMFNELCAKVKAAHKDERLLLIGFAETATAIGAAVACGMDCIYMHTTRETLPGADYIFFSEEHSHATQQKLISNNLNKLSNEVDRIIFIEDEVTTGKTILNIISALKQKYPQICNYSVASLLNGMDDTCLKKYSEENIDLIYLVKTDHKKYSQIAEKYTGNGKYTDCTSHISGNADYNICELDYTTCNMNTRKPVYTKDYIKANEALWDHIRHNINLSCFKNILVIGTEEFMYPALFTASKIEKMKINVRCHSTTRSPITVSSEPEYPLHTRYTLNSFYDSERITYIYDLAKYDCVIIMTDACFKSPCHPDSLNAGINSLVKALEMNDNNNIYIIKWNNL